MYSILHFSPSKPSGGECFGWRTWVYPLSSRINDFILSFFLLMLLLDSLIQPRHQPSSAFPPPPFRSVKRKEEKKIDVWLISTSPTPTSLVQAEDGATWSLGTDIKGSREACYLEVQWQTPAVAVPLISPSSFLPPSLHCLSSSRLVTVLSAACSAVYTRPAWGPGGWRGWHKEGMQKKEGDFEVQARLVVLQQTIQEINFYEL